MFVNKKTHNSYSLRYNQNNYILRFGRFGIKTLSFGRLTEDQLNPILYSFLKVFKEIENNKKFIKFWNLILFNSSLTKFNLESRMGKGKGSIYTKSIFLKPGIILFEFDGISDQQMLKIFNFIKNKISLKIIYIKK